ncbi:hypothetical protein FHX82_005126 [Amycolatopsis bartoniae]|nr:hypothetical protein [Amycolatopsis bartoniae]
MRAASAVVGLLFLAAGVVTGSFLLLFLCCLFVMTTLTMHVARGGVRLRPPEP